MANKNFAQFPAYGASSTGNPVNGGQQWLVGYNEATGGEVKTQVRDLFTNLYLTSGINMSFDNGNVPGIAKNLLMGTNAVFHPDNRVPQNNGGMFTNIVFASYSVVSGQGGILLGNAHNYFTGVQDPSQQYYARMNNLLLGSGVSLSANTSQWGSILAGGNSTYKMLNTKNQLLNWGTPIFAVGVGNLINVLSSTKPYVGQMNNGNQLSAYHAAQGCPIFQTGNNNEIHSSAEGGYICNGYSTPGPQDQYGGIFQSGWGSRIYGANSGIAQFFTAASTISGQCGNCFQFGGYGNMIVESEAVYQMGGNNNFISVGGNCGHGGTVNIGAGNRIGNIVHVQPSGNIQRIQNTCDSLLNIGQSNKLSIDNGLNFGSSNNIAGNQILNFGNYNKIGICNFSNNGSDNKFGAASYHSVIGNNNCTGVWYFENPADDIIYQEAPQLTIGANLSSQSSPGSLFVGVSSKYARIVGGICLGFNHDIGVNGGTHKRPIILGSNVKTNNNDINDYMVVALDRQNIVSNNYTSPKRSEQFLLSARGGTFIPGKLGIGIDTMTTATSATLHVNAAGNIIFANLPTSNAGLSTGTLWNNGGVLSVAP